MRNNAMRLHDAIEEWRLWGVSAKPELVHVFDQGLNHLTAKLQVDGEPRVLKVFSTANPHETRAQEIAAASGLAPALSYVDAAHRYVVMRLAVGSNPAPEQVCDEQIERIADALNSLHSLTLAHNQSDAFDLVWFCDGYLTTAGLKAQQLHQDVLPYLEEFVEDPTPRCWCHNDLVVANMFVDTQRVQFIDWEYADLHNPWFDLAAVVLYLKLSRAQATVLLSRYARISAAQVDTRIFFVSQIALLWGDMLWHLAKFGESYWVEMQAKLDQLHALLHAVEKA